MKATPIFDLLVQEFAERDPAVKYYDLLMGNYPFHWDVIARIPLSEVNPLPKPKVVYAPGMIFFDHAEQLALNVVADNLRKQNIISESGMRQALGIDLETLQERISVINAWQPPDLVGDNSGEPMSFLDEIAPAWDKLAAETPQEAPESDEDDDPPSDTGNGAEAPESPVRDDEAPVPGVRPIVKPPLPKRIPGASKVRQIQNFIALTIESFKTAFAHPTSNAA